MKEVLSSLAALTNELKLIYAYACAVFRESWVIVVEVLLILTDVVERVLGTWLLPSSRVKVELGVAVLVVAQYRAYRRLALQLSAQPKPTELVIHPGQGSAVYIEVPSGAAQPKGNYFLFHLTAENRGSQNSVIRKFGLELEGMQAKYENLKPVRRNSIQTRTAQTMMRTDFILQGTSLVVPAHAVSSTGVHRGVVYMTGKMGPLTFRRPIRDH